MCPTGSSVIQSFLNWWTKEVGRGSQRRPRIDTYLNHWLTLRTETETRAHEEFREFDKYAHKRREAGETIEDVARDMGAIGALFRDIEDIRRKDIAPFLELRGIMNAGAVTPLLLWLLCPGTSPRRCEGDVWRPLRAFWCAG